MDCTRPKTKVSHLPGMVGSRRISLIQPWSSIIVKADNQSRDAEWPAAVALSVTLKCFKHFSINISNDMDATSRPPIYWMTTKSAPVSRWLCNALCIPLWQDPPQSTGGSGTQHVLCLSRYERQLSALKKVSEKDLGTQQETNDIWSLACMSYSEM